MADVILKLYDIDGCVYHSYQAAKDNSVAWVLETNEDFLQQQTAEIKSAGYAKVVVAYGTNRQDYDTNKYNSQFFGPSCTPVLPLFQRYFQQRLGCDVVLDPLWTADIHSGKQAGYSYKATLAEERGMAEGQLHPQAIFDDYKISLIYAHAHRIAMLNPEAEHIVVDYYDDNSAILSEVHAFFTRHPELLPPNVKLRVFQYDAVQFTQLPDVNGEGRVDASYEWSVRYLAAKTRLDRINSDSEDNRINSAEDLLRYHENSRCVRTSSAIRMDVVRNLDVGQFLQFRDGNMAVLAANNQLGGALAYTTARSLALEGFIPESYLEPANALAASHEQDLDQKNEDDGVLICTAETGTDVGESPLSQAAAGGALEKGSDSFRRSQLALKEQVYMQSQDETDLAEYIAMLEQDVSHLDMVCPDGFDCEKALTVIESYIREMNVRAQPTLFLPAKQSAEIPLIRAELNALGVGLRKDTNNTVRYMIACDFCWKWNIPIVGLMADANSCDSEPATGLGPAVN